MGSTILRQAQLQSLGHTNSPGHILEASNQVDSKPDALESKKGCKAVGPLRGLQHSYD